MSYNLLNEPNKRPVDPLMDLTAYDRVQTAVKILWEYKDKT